jgi:ferredoxin--NADP+ reductase
MRELPQDEYIGEAIRSKLIYFPTVTREPFKNRGRVTELLKSPEFYAEIDLPMISSEHDRVMICGSPSMLSELKTFCIDQGFKEGNSGEPGDFVIEKAFVEK